MAKRRSKKNSGHCIYVPQINMEPSELYVGLLNMGVSRPLTNLIYAKYLTTDAADKLDALGKKRNDQDQHSAKDLYDYFNVSSIQLKQGYSLSRIENKYKVVEKDGGRRIFNYNDAYRIARDVNANEDSYVAQVIQRGDNFTVVIDKLDARTQIYKSDVEASTLAWQSLEDGFRNLGLTLDYVALAAPDLINPGRVSDFLDYMGRLARSKVETFNARDINILLRTGKDEPLVQNLLNYGWGSVKETAAKAYDVLINPSNYAADTVNFVKSALFKAKQKNVSEFKALKKNITDTSENSTSILKSYYDSSEEVSIHSKLKELNKKWGINHTIVKTEDSNISRLSDAASEAIFTLERQRRYLEEQQGRVKEGIEIEQTLNTITEELNKKKYYSGLLTFLQKANGYALGVEKLLQNIPEGGTTLEHSIAVGKALAKAKTMHDGYYSIVEALSTADNLLIDENITNEDLKLLTEQAKNVKNIMDKYEKSIGKLRQDTMLDLAQSVLGSDTANGKSLADLVQFAEADSSLMDFLYSCERVSDPLVATMGTLIRDAQLERDKKLRSFAERIRDANRKLADAKENSKFMYEGFEQDVIDWKRFNEEKDWERRRLKNEGFFGADLQNELNRWIYDNTEDTGNGVRLPSIRFRSKETVYYIKSTHNWGEYIKDRRAEERRLHQNGVKGFAFYDAMEKWEHDNTVEVPVDWDENNNVIRTERVPDSKYDKAMFFDNSAQEEYYNTMMKIKGEIGTMLPSYAQRQYFPPQRRATWMDIVSEAKERGLSAKDVAKNLLDRMNPLKVKQDDTNYLEGTKMYGEDDIRLSHSNYDDTLLRRVPIYYTNKLRDQSDVSWEFSGALQALAATATNYEAMFGVKDLIETMADFLKERPVAERDEDGKKRVDIVKWGEVIVGKVIRKLAKSTNTSRLVDGFVSKHIYNEQLARGNEGGLLRKGQLLMQALINYTSINQLAPNLKGAVSNYLVGEAQMLIESGAGEYYNPKNYFWAHGHMFGQGVRAGTVMDHINNTTNTLGHLLEERFDPLQEVYTELGGKRYLTGFKKIFGGFNIMGLYSAGESLIHLVNMYAVLDHEKVLLNGKETSLYNVLTREASEDGTSQRLAFKEGATMLDGSEITEAYLDSVKDKIRLVNQKTHGSMNSEDKGLIHRNMAGRAVMNFRQWMVEHYSRRYRGRYFDGTTRTWQEGYYNTVYKLAKSYMAEWFGLNIDAQARWSQLDETQKGNVRRALSEFAVFAALLGVSVALGNPKDHKGEWGYRFLIYQIRRLIMDEQASIPILPANVAAGVAWGGEKAAEAMGADIEPGFQASGGLLREGITLLNSPVASVKTINGFLYPITGLGEINQKYQRGPNKDKNKYWTKFKKQTLPFYGQIDQLIQMGDEDYIFNVFDNIAYNKAQ